MSTNTRWAVLKDMVQRYNLGWVAVNNATQSGITTFSDDSVFGGRTRNIPQIGADVRSRQNSVTGDTGTNTYGEGRVSATGSFGAGQVTMDPDPGSTALPETPVVANNYSEYLVLRDPTMRFEDACNYLNATITDFGWARQVVPVTMCRDGDMLSSSVDETNDWVNGGSATLTKTAATFARPFRHIALTGSGSSQYIETISMAVEQDASYYLEVMAAKITAGAADDGTLSFRDVTNSTTLTLANTTIDEKAPLILANNVTMGSTTELGRVRIAKANGSSGDIAIGWVILRRNDARKFTIADRPAKLLWLGELRAATGGTWQDRSWTNMSPVPAKAQQIDAGIWQFNTQVSTSGLSLWYEEFVQPAQMTADSSTTAIEVEALSAVATEMWLRPMRQDPRWQATYERALTEAVRAKQNRMAAFRSLRQQEQLVISPLRV